MPVARRSPPAPENALKQHLLDEYGSFGDKRIKRLESGKSFIVDDRGPGDIGADGNLLSYFCMIFAAVEATDRVRVTLNRNVPMGTPVRRWLAQNAGASLQSSTVASYSNLEFDVAPGTTDALRDLAASFREIVTAGSYRTPNYKYVCPRTAKALVRLANALDRHW